jgi:hypothetical protein
MRIDFKDGGWIEGDIREGLGCDCPTCTCPPSYLFYWKIYHVGGAVRMSGSVGADITESSSEEERNKLLKEELIRYGGKYL